MIAAIVLERGLAQPGLGPSCVDATLFLPTEDGPAVFMTAETMWFVVGPLPSAGENDGLAAESEFAGWAAEMFSGDHAVEKTGDMSDLACTIIDDETTRLRQQRLLVSPWRTLLQPQQVVGCPFWVVFSIVSCVRAIQMLAAFAFPFCFQYLLAAMLAAMLMESFCLLLFSGIERVRVFLQAPFVSGSWSLRTCCTCLER